MLILQTHTVLFTEYQTTFCRSLWKKTPTFVFSNLYFVFPVQIESRGAHVTFTAPSVMQIA